MNFGLAGVVGRVAMGLPKSSDKRLQGLSYAVARFFPVTKGQLIYSLNNNGAVQSYFPPISDPSVNVYAENLYGVFLGNRVTASTRGSIVGVNPTTGDFVVAYNNTSILNIAFYNRLGELVGVVDGPGPINSGNPFDSNKCVAVSPTNGDVVVSYNNNVLNPTYVRYSSARVLQGTANIILAETTSTTSCAYLSNGDFVICYDGNADALIFQRYNSAGVSQQTVTVETIGATGRGSVYQVAALADGGFVIAYYTSATAIKFARYNATGVLQGAVTTVLASGGAQSGVSVSGSPQGGFVIAYSDAAGLKFGRYNAAGALQGSVTVVDPVVNTTPSVAHAVDGSFSILYASGNRLARYTATGVIKSAVTSGVLPAGALTSSLAYSNLLPGYIYANYVQDTSYTFGISVEAQGSPKLLGFAQESRPLGGTFKVKTVGVTATNAATPYSLDTSAVGGQAASAAGTYPNISTVVY